MGVDANMRMGFAYRVVAQPVVAVHMGVEYGNDRLVAYTADAVQQPAAYLYAAAGVHHHNAVARHGKPGLFMKPAV